MDRKALSLMTAALQLAGSNKMRSAEVHSRHPCKPTGPVTELEHRTFWLLKASNCVYHCRHSRGTELSAITGTLFSAYTSACMRKGIGTSYARSQN